MIGLKIHAHKAMPHLQVDIFKTINSYVLLYKLEASALFIKFCHPQCISFYASWDVVNLCAVL